MKNPNQQKRTEIERVEETTPETQPDNCQPLAIPLRMTHGANEGPDFSTDH